MNVIVLSFLLEELRFFHMCRHKLHLEEPSLDPLHRSAMGEVVAKMVLLVVAVELRGMQSASRTLRTGRPTYSFFSTD